MKTVTIHSKITIKEVAEFAAVSQATVSRVINDVPTVNPDIRQKVKQAIQVLGYQPNYFSQALATDRSSSIGMVVRAFGGHFFGELMRSVEEVLRAAGQQVVVLNGQGEREQETATIDFLKARRCEALILHIDHLSEEELVELNRKGPPLVIVNRYFESLKTQCVFNDNIMGGYLATKHLIDKGHREIACITGPLHTQDAMQRFQGYQKALEEAQIEYDPLLMVESDFSIQHGQKSTADLLGRKKIFSAIFFGNDDMAMGGVETLHKAGLKVPEDISIVGFDDMIYSRFFIPQLTTVRVSAANMGKIAGQLALSLIGKKPDNRIHEIDCELVTRASVASK